MGRRAYRLKLTEQGTWIYRARMRYKGPYGGGTDVKIRPNFEALPSELSAQPPRGTLSRHLDIRMSNPFAADLRSTYSPSRTNRPSSTFHTTIQSNSHPNDSPHKTMDTVPQSIIRSTLLTLPPQTAHFESQTHHSTLTLATEVALIHADIFFAQPFTTRAFSMSSPSLTSLHHHHHLLLVWPVTGNPT